MTDDSPGRPAPLTGEQRRLADSHLHLVEEQARHLFSTFPRMDRDELISYGYLGLVQAAKNYRPEVGVSFPNFAAHRIRGQILDEIRKLSRYSERQQELRKKIRHAKETVEERLSREKDLSHTVEQLIDFLGANPLPQSVDFAAAASVASAEQSPETSVHYARMREHVRKAAQELDTKERALVSRIYFHNQSIDDAAHHIGVTSSWAHRLRARALKILKAAFRRPSS